MSRVSNRNEILDGSIASTSHSLLRIAGGWGNIGGPGLFMIRSLTAGVTTSLFTGMVGSITFAMFYGTAALPFAIFSCIGFCIGTFSFYYDAVRKSLLYLDRYPRLLQLYLDVNFPSEGFNKWPIERLRGSNFNSWTMRSMLMVSWLSATPAIENIIDSDEQQAVESDTARAADEK